MIAAASRIQVLGVCSILEHTENSYEVEALENQGQNGCEIEKEEGYCFFDLSLSRPSERYWVNRSLIFMPLCIAWIFKLLRNSSSIRILICTIGILSLTSFTEDSKTFTSFYSYLYIYLLSYIYISFHSFKNSNIQKYIYLNKENKIKVFGGEF